MCSKSKYLLKDYKEKVKRFGDRCVELFYFTEEISQIECCLCIPLAKKLNADVYWYKYNDQAIVCVMEENVHEAIKFGKELIVQNFDRMTAEYIENSRKYLVFDDYSIIATFKTEDIYGLSSWCHNIDDELIVKTNSRGEQCVLTKEPLEFTSRIQSAYRHNPFNTLLNFDFYKI